MLLASTPAAAEEAATATSYIVPRLLPVFDVIIAIRSCGADPGLLLGGGGCSIARVEGHRSPVLDILQESRKLSPAAATDFSLPPSGAVVAIVVSVSGGARPVKRAVAVFGRTVVVGRVVFAAFVVDVFTGVVSEAWAQ